MQVNTQNIQRPSLYIDFLGLELIWNNEYLTYIQTTVNAVTSNLRKIAKTTANNIKKQLNDDSYSAENILDRINSMKNQSLEDFSNKYSQMIYREQDRRLGRL
jgi:hypothetical protein